MLRLMPQLLRHTGQGPTPLLCNTRVGRLFVEGLTTYFQFCGPCDLLQLLNTAILARKLAWTVIPESVWLCADKTTIWPSVGGALVSSATTALRIH